MKRVRAFWDASAMVPLCVAQADTRHAFSFFKHYRAVIWWAMPIELTSAFARLLRNGEITAAANSKAQQQAERHAKLWHVVAPSAQIASDARRLLERYPLRASDALQLSAALTWCEGRPNKEIFLTFDERLGEAAHSVGFTLG